MRIRRAISMAFALAMSASVHAQDWPAKPVRIIVPYPAGGVVDVMTRVVTTRMASDTGQPMLVEARAGANGSIAAEAVSRAPNDGYTLLVSAPFLLTNPIMEKDVRWAVADFTPVARYALSPSFFLVPANSPAATLKAFIELARSKPGTPYGEGGVGTTQYMAMQMLQSVAGFRLEEIAYKGAPPVMPDLVNGLVQFALIPSSVAIPQVRAGKVRALGNSSDKRSPALPDIPTIAELGFPEVTVVSWYAFHAPAGTPPAVIRRISDAVRAATTAPEVHERTANAGGETAFLDTAAFTAFLRDDQARWEQFVKVMRK